MPRRTDVGGMGRKGGVPGLASLRTLKQKMCLLTIKEMITQHIEGAGRTMSGLNAVPSEDRNSDWLDCGPAFSNHVNKNDRHGVTVAPSGTFSTLLQGGGQEDGQKGSSSKIVIVVRSEPRVGYPRKRLERGDGQALSRLEAGCR